MQVVRNSSSPADCSLPLTGTHLSKKSRCLPTGLKHLEITPVSQEGKHPNEADGVPTPDTCRDPNGGSEVVDADRLVATLAQGLIDGTKEPSREAAATWADQPISTSVAPACSSCSCQPAEESFASACSAAVERLLQSEPGTTERLNRIDEVLMSLAANNELPSYVSFNEKKRKALHE